MTCCLSQKKKITPKNKPQKNTPKKLPGSISAVLRGRGPPPQHSIARPAQTIAEHDNDDEGRGGGLRIIAVAVCPPSSSDAQDGSEELVRYEEEGVGWNFVHKPRGGALHERLRSGEGEGGVDMEGNGWAGCQ